MRIKRLIRTILVMVMLAGSFQSAGARSLALDSIATWGKFPKFCIDVYRCGDKFFNGYDTTYVQGTGYKFNAKLRLDSWLDYYNFSLPNSTRLQMISHPSTSAGLWLNYMAVSVGYDINLSQIFGDNNKARERWSFGFSCALFSAEAYLIKNDVGTRITRLGEGNDNKLTHPINFDGINTSTWGVSASYFFNHKKYSQAAAFNMSRIQRKSAGSFIAGFTVSQQDYNFDFSSLPPQQKLYLPSDWEDESYKAKNRNYNFIIGYGYNWVPRKNWTFAIYETPHIGWRRGYLSTPGQKKTSFSLLNRAKVSIVWHNGRWFAALIGQVDTNILYDKTYTFDSSYLSGNLMVGYRFNLW